MENRQLFDYLLRLGDDALVEAQRLGEWSARAPEMEEDIALANIALDQLGAARMFLTYAGEVEGAGRDEDALAYLRERRRLPQRTAGRAGRRRGSGRRTSPPRSRSCCSCPPASTCSTRRLAAVPTTGSPRSPASRVKESAYHLDHAALWTVRLGGGTHESHRRMKAARRGGLAVHVRAVRGRRDPGGPVAEGVAVDPATLHATSGTTASTACCGRPSSSPGRRRGARPAAGRGGTPKRCPTCSPRCRCCTARIRVRHGDDGVAWPAYGCGRGRRRSRRSAWSRSTTWASCATSRSTPTDRAIVTITPTYSGCPAMDVIRADVADAAGGGRCRAMSTCARC